MDDLSFHVDRVFCTDDNVADVCNKENLLQEKPDHTGDEEEQEQHDDYPFCDADGGASAAAGLGCRVLLLIAGFHRSSVGEHQPSMQMKTGASAPAGHRPA
jgi:hypothetical protein